MSRLDSAIRRLLAQRSCLDRAIEMIAGVPGPVLELGLGNGRTYDHLRERLRGRDIYVFERAVAAHPDCIPPSDRLVIGDFQETLPHATALFGTAALVHADFGSGDRPRNEALAAFMGPAIGRLVASGGVVASDQALSCDRFTAVSLPEGVEAGRYFLYRVA